MIRGYDTYQSFREITLLRVGLAVHLSPLTSKLIKRQF